jgi:hypothetical protein
MIFPTQATASASVARRAYGNAWIDPMSFRYSFTFPISGPNKLPRFRSWAAENAPDIDVSLPPQVPVRSTAMTIRLKSAEDRAKLMQKLEGVRL